MGGFLMGKFRKTYDIAFKKKAVDLYLKDGMGRPRTRPEDPEAKIKRLEAENELQKKLLKM